MIFGVLIDDPLLLIDVFGSCYLAEVFPDMEALDDVFPMDCLLLVAPLVDFSGANGSPSFIVDNLFSLLFDSIKYF